jgi:hypothetical protein
MKMCLRKFQILSKGRGTFYRNEKKYLRSRKELEKSEKTIKKEQNGERIMKKL